MVANKKFKKKMKRLASAKNGSESTDDSVEDKNKIQKSSESSSGNPSSKKQKTTRSAYGPNPGVDIKHGSINIKEQLNHNIFTTIQESLPQSCVTNFEYSISNFYIPQLNDEIVFIRDGFKSYQQSLAKTDKEFFKTYFLPWFNNLPEVDNFPPSIHCVVSNIEYKSVLFTKEKMKGEKEFLRQRITFFTLTLKKKANIEN